MSDDRSEPPMGSHQLLSSIDSFSQSVTQFLLPVVRFVGHKSNLFDALERQFSGLIHEKRYSEKPAHLVVFDEVPYDYLGSENRLSAEAAYLFCLEEHQELTDDHLALLENRMSLVLISPGKEEVIWHAKVLLILQDIAYANSSRCYPSLLSLDVCFRRCISLLIAASINHTSCMICVGTSTVQKMLVDFVFGLHPSEIRPFYFDYDRLDAESLPSDRVSVTLPHCETTIALKALAKALTNATASRPVIAIVVCDDSEKVTKNMPFPALTLPGLDVRELDAHLIAYWYSAFKAHGNVSPKYYSKEQIHSSIKESGGNPDSYLRSLSTVVPELDILDDVFVDFIARHDRLSIDDIFDVAEHRVMQNLRDRSIVVDAASNAAGIPKVTFHKRMRRLADKETLLSLLYSVRSND